MLRVLSVFSNRNIRKAAENNETDPRVFLFRLIKFRK